MDEGFFEGEVLAEDSRRWSLAGRFPFLYEKANGAPLDAKDL